MYYKNCASRNQKSAMPSSIVSVKAMHKSLTSKYKTVRNVSRPSVKYAQKFAQNAFGNFSLLCSSCFPLYLYYAPI